MRKFLTLVLTITTCVTSDAFHDELKNVKRATEYLDVSNEAVTKIATYIQESIGGLIPGRGTQKEVDAVMAEHMRILNRQLEIENKINDLNQLKNDPVSSVQGLDEINRKTDGANERRLNIARRRAFHRKAMDAWKLLRRNNFKTLQELESNIESGDIDENKLNARNLMRELNVQSASDLLAWYKSDKGSLPMDIESLKAEESSYFERRNLIDAGVGLLNEMNSVEELEDTIRKDLEEIRSQQVELKSRFDMLIPNLQNRAKRYLAQVM